MKRILALLVIGLALVAGLLWWLGRESTSGSAASAAPLVERALTPPPPSAPEWEQPPVEALETRIESAAIAEPTAEAEAATGATLPGSTLTVLAIDNATELPVADAALHLATSDATRKVKLDGDSWDLEKALQQVGVTAHSDANGEATLPWSGPSGTVCARRGELFGYAQVNETSEQPVRIRMCFDRTLLIRTVDTFGAPCPGVPVHMWLRSASQNSRFWSGTSAGPQAEVFIRHAESVCLRAQVKGELSVALGIPTTRPVEAIVPNRPWTDAPITLTVPAHGSIELALVDDTGAPVLRRVVVSLTPKLPDGQTFEARRAADGYSENGSVRFDFVEAGLELKATVRVPGREAIESAILGPARAGEQVRATIDCGPQPTSLIAHLTDPEGAPLASCKLKSLFLAESGGGSTTSTSSVQSDANGRVEQTLSVEFRPGATRTWRLSCDREDATLQIEVDLSRELPSGPTDLGELRLAASPVLAAGIVVDDQDRGIAGASVAIEGASGLNVRTDAQGRFRLVGSLPRAEGTLLASRNGSTSAPLPFQPGATDLRLVLERQGSFAGTVLLDDSTPLAMLRLRIERDGGRSSSIGDLQLGAGNEFRSGELAPGLVNCSFEMGGEAVWSASGVEVRGGETTRDPRMQPVDLRGLFRDVRIEVLGPDREPIESGYVAIGIPKRTRGPGNAVAIERGEALVPLRSEGADLEIHSRGYRTQRLTQVDGPRTVVLERALEVRVVLDDTCPLPEKPFELQANLVARGTEESRSFYQIYQRNHLVGQAHLGTLSDEHTFGPSRELRLFVEEPGPQRVYFVCIKRQVYGSDSEVVDARAQDQELEIGPQDAGRVLRVAPDPADYAEVRARQD
jgi:hypothetical protein